MTQEIDDNEEEYKETLIDRLIIVFGGLFIALVIVRVVAELVFEVICLLTVKYMLAHGYHLLNP